MLGSGTALDPYIIQDVDDLQNVNLDLTAYYELEGDIDASATVGWNGGRGFLPIGNWNDVTDTLEGFMGHFDGKGFTISNLFIFAVSVGPPATAYPKYACVGLFAAIDRGGTVQNFSLSNPNITGGNRINCGAIAGTIGEGGFVEPPLWTFGTGVGYVSDCSVIGGQITVEAGCWALGGAFGCIGSGSVVTRVTTRSMSIIQVTGDETGGLVGINEGTIDNCYSIACSLQNCWEMVGGLVGLNFSIGLSPAIIRNSYSTNDIAGWREIGGLVGGCYATLSSIIDSFATGNITTDSGDSAGGLIGLMSNGTILRCYATGNVTAVGTANNSLGGLVGRVDQGTIQECYATGNVDGADWWDVGGFIGWANSAAAVLIERCFATGAVTGIVGGGFLGGFIGETDPNTSVSDCYARGAVTGDDLVGGFTGELDGAITNCYSTGLVTANLDGGGLTPTAWPGAGTATECFWDVQTSGYATSGHGTGKSTVEMKTKSTFTDAGWDFITPIWYISASQNDGYPCFVAGINAPTVQTSPATGVI